MRFYKEDVKVITPNILEWRALDMLVTKDINLECKKKSVSA